ECKTIQERIVSGVALSDDEERHLLACSECQRFAEIHNLAVGLPEISAATDAAVLAECHAAIRRPSMHIFRKVAATAVACLAVLLAFSAYRVNHRDTQDGIALSADEQWMLGYSLENDDLSEIELSLSALELPLVASSNSASQTANYNSVKDLQYEILSLEMDMNAQ
ncbi:MAG: hypothetical protein J5833_08040, partial [Victivallales bacterium]|nr:hypothetical protein [Victivallales bacterium]